MRAWAIIPAKCFERAKSRLAPALSAPERRALAEEMFRTVLAAALGSTRIDGALVITECPTVTRLAVAAGARVIADAPAGLLGDSVDAAVAALPTGARAAVVLMGDLPGLTTGDVDALLDRLQGSQVVLAPDRQQEGTNALALHLPPAIQTAFGRRDSFSEHLRRCRDAQIETATLTTAALAFDVDWPEDVALITRGAGDTVRRRTAS